MINNRTNQSIKQLQQTYDYSTINAEENRLLEAFEQRMINEILEYEAWLQEVNDNEI